MTHGRPPLQLPPLLLPPTSWLAVLLAAEAQGQPCTLATGGRFRHQSLLHRARISTSLNGTLASAWAGLPVQHAGGHDLARALDMPLAEARLVVDPTDPLRWRRRLWRQLQAAYGRSAYWLHFAPRLEAILLSEGARLLPLNLAVIGWLTDAFGLRLLPESAAAPNLSFERGLSGFRATPYVQCFEGGFVAEASALDLLLNHGPGGLRVLRGAVDLNDLIIK